MSRRGFAFVVVAALVAVVLTLPAAASHSWGSYHWPRPANPFTLKVVDSVTSSWDAYLLEARNDWTASTVLDLAAETGSTGTVDRKRCRAVSGKIRACNYTYGFNGWLGVAQIWANGSHITQGTVKLNDSYFNTSTYNTPPWRRLVMCQEVGHTFGLDHQDENFSNPNLGTCMDYTSDPDGPLSNEHPNQHDYDQLDAIYGHLDGVASAPQVNPAANAIGRAIAKRVKPLLYEDDLGQGRKRLIWVYWVDPGASHPEPPKDAD